jgi:IPT/TIG domain/S-layer homology domain
MRRLALVLCLCASTASAATFTVTNTNDSGAGSLRDAITLANNNAGADTITFNVSGSGCDGSGVCTIALDTALPTLSSPVTIDGYTQPGALVNTNATGALNTALKIVVTPGPGFVPVGIGFASGGGGSTIRGLVVTGPFDYTVSSDFSDGNIVAGCFIGTNAAGTAVVPGGARGLYVNGSDDLRVGGPAPADRNLIAGHSQFNVAVQNGSMNAVVQGNLIGTNAAVSALIGGPTLSGIQLGSNTPGAVVRGNVIGGAGQGIQVGSVSGPGHGATIEGNWIGTDVSGTLNLGNTGNGILAQGQQAAVGGVGAGEGNVIAFNGGAGVYIDYSTINIEKNPIRGNSIYGNGTANGAGGRSTLGIDLGNQTGPGLTLNDDQDADAGPNTNQNFPLIASAVSGGGDTTIEGTLNSTPSTTFTIDFYSNAACTGRPQGFIQGRTYLGSTQVTTAVKGKAAIDTVLDGVTLEAGDVVTATATDPDGNTSEFAQRIVVSSNPGSGPATGAAIGLQGFNFLDGASVTVGGAPATNVVVVSFNQINATTPSLPPGSLNNVTVTNTDGSAGTLPNGWIADFLDVPNANPFYSNVTTLVRNAITVGTGGGNYGVGQNTLRQQMAVFLLKSKNGVCYVPPPCAAQVFPDVPCSSGFAPWINELVTQGITGGCGGGLYCPTNPVNRQQMAVFLLKTFEGGDYAPPACTAATFGDVPCSSPFAPWIYELVARTITAGCGGGNYCPLTNATRGQMAVFLVKTFNLQ